MKIEKNIFLEGKQTVLKQVQEKLDTLKDAVILLVNTLFSGRPSNPNKRSRGRAVIVGSSRKAWMINHCRQKKRKIQPTAKAKRKRKTPTNPTKKASRKVFCIGGPYDKPRRMGFDC